MLAILARVTKRARLLILGNPIAHRRDPVRVAEEMAMVDVISRGRLECGFVRGVPYEVWCANSNPGRSNERMWEAHDLILKAWTSHDGPFSFEGEFFHHRNVNIWPRPYQAPHPPIWISSTSPGGSEQVGEKGYTQATFFSGFAGTKALFESYRNGWYRAGRAEPPADDRFAYSALVYTGDTDAAGRAGAEKLLWSISHNNTPLHYQDPPGFRSLAESAKAIKTGRVGYRHSLSLDLDHLIEKGFLFCGSPDTVFSQIKRFYDHVGGFGHLLAQSQAGFMDHDETLRGIQLLAQEVAPRLSELHAQPASV